MSELDDKIKFLENRSERAEQLKEQVSRGGYLNH